jgi:hypothetical protein
VDHCAVVEPDGYIHNQRPFRSLEGFCLARQMTEIRHNAVDLLQINLPGAEMAGLKVGGE